MSSKSDDELRRVIDGCLLKAYDLGRIGQPFKMCPSAEIIIGIVTAHILGKAAEANFTDQKDFPDEP